jgi:hypothetical protein
MRLLTALVALLPSDAMADDLDARATALFSAAFSETCLAAFLEDGSLIEPPQRFQVTMGSSYGEPEPATLWQFRCDMGAYNLVHVFLIHTEFDGLRPLALPQPVLQVVNEDPEDFESPVKKILVTSWTAGFRAINAAFDPSSGLLSEVSFWRGIGDASSSSVWVLKDGGALLQRFEADASYDGEIAPQLVLEFP